jgi:hypothetical protein
MTVWVLIKNANLPPMTSVTGKKLSITIGRQREN